MACLDFHGADRRKLIFTVDLIGHVAFELAGQIAASKWKREIAVGSHSFIRSAQNACKIERPIPYPNAGQGLESLI